MPQYPSAPQPQTADALSRQGAAFWQADRLGEALACFDQLLPIAADKPDVLNKRGVILAALRRFDEALASYDQALALEPDFAVAWNNRGALLRDMRRWKEAIESFSQALAHRPLFTEALINRGLLLGNELHTIPAAIDDLSQALQLAPAQDYLQGELLHLRMHVGDWEGYDRQAAMLHAGVRGGAHVAKPFMYQAVSQSPRDLQTAARLYAERFHPVATSVRRKPRSAGQKIRIGYVSGEFRLQATALLAAGLYEQHDRSRFEVVAFDNGFDDGSSMRQRLEKAFDKFVSIAHLSDSEAAQRIAEEDIDILVNLNGYFGAERMGVFAHRPAPVQVSYLGFPGTLGADYIDYLIADDVVIPPDEQRFYHEAVVSLPDSYQVNDSRRLLPSPPPSRASCGLPASGFVFCNFNHSYKLTPNMFAVWMRLLARVDGSVLWLLESNRDVAARMRRTAWSHGVSGERLVFAPPQPQDLHMARLQLADLFLDSLPYNAHTTGSDALWAGVPFLTCRGTAFAGRVGASLLRAVGLPDLTCETLSDYEATALSLAREPGRLAALRARLAAGRVQAPLFDTARFCRHLESAYRAMWDQACHGTPPRGFRVKAPDEDGHIRA